MTTSETPGEYQEMMVTTRWTLALLLVAFLAVVSPPAMVMADLTSDRNALLAFHTLVVTNSSTRARKVLAWNGTTTPCNWRGIACSQDGTVVTRVQLPGLGLVGDVPRGTLGSLAGLRYLSLRSNRLSGALLEELRNCTELRSVYLQNNLLSGRIPDSIDSDWPQLIRLDLAFNRHNGSIPESIGRVHRLRSFLLGNNSFSGSIPSSLGELKSLGQLDLSENELSGPVPDSLRRFSSSAFTGNSICGPPLAVACPTPPPAPSPTTPPTPTDHSKRHRARAGRIAGIVLGSVTGIALLLGLVICCLLKRKRADPKPPRTREVDDVDGYSSSLQNQQNNGARNTKNKLVFFEAARRSYDLEDLLRASAEVLGKGSVGTTYKAVLEDGTLVAVKRLGKEFLPGGYREFEHHLHVLGSFKHRNLVPLRAYYVSQDEKLLVYDFMARGSMSALLHGDRGTRREPLDWASRLGTALGAARCVAYLHDQGGFVHGNIKSSNVLLAKNFDACLSDAGLVQFLGNNRNRMLGYRAPEVTETRKCTLKSDVYSFGVLLLELLTGRAPAEEGLDLPRWVQSVVREEWTAEVFDLELMRYRDIEDELVQVLQLALACVSALPEQRPSMKQVVVTLQELKKDDTDLQLVSSDPSDGRSASDVSDRLHR